MKRVHLFAIAIVCQSSLGQAAVFTSSTTLNQSFQTSISVRSSLTHPSLRESSSRSYSRSITSGIDSAAFSADTDADNGFISAMQFKPIGLPGAATFSRSLNYQRVVVDVPADFPNPPVTHVENSVFQERIQLDTPTNVTPMLVNSTVDPLLPINGGAPWFVMTHDLTLAPISFTLHGTYEAIGPLTSKIIPFSVTYEATAGLSTRQRSGVRGGAGFGNGFQAKLASTNDLQFRAVNSQVIDEVVDEVRFRLSFTNDFSLRLVLRTPPVPEPSSAMLLGMASMALVARSRVRT